MVAKDTMMMTKTSVIRYSFTLFFIVFIALITPNVAIHAAEEIGHPFFQSEDFKRLTEEQTRGGVEIESLQREGVIAPFPSPMPPVAHVERLGSYPLG